MKKIISVLIIVAIIILGTINSYAVGENTSKNIELNSKGQTTIKKDTKTVELTLSLGKFTGIEENVVLGYESTLEYDKDMFESVTVKGLNGWTVNYEPTTKVLIGDVATAKANTEITKITLTLKDGIKPETVGKVKLNNVELTDGTNDFAFNKEVTITMEEEKKPEDGNKNNTNNTNGNTNTNTNTDKNNIAKKGNNTDKTTSGTKLPSAGIKNILIIAIVIMAIAMVIFKIKSRDIKY